MTTVLFLRMSCPSGVEWRETHWRIRALSGRSCVSLSLFSPALFTQTVHVPNHYEVLEYPRCVVCHNDSVSRSVGYRSTSGII